MEYVKVCRHCGSALGKEEDCGCPGAVREREAREEVIRQRNMDEVHIRLDKIPGDESYHREFTASSNVAALNAMALLILETARMTGQSVEHVFAVLATVLFAPDGDEKETT